MSPFAPLRLALDRARTAAAPALRRLRPAGRTAQGERLEELAGPWRTALQLDRLGRSSRSPDETFRFAVLGDAEPGRFWVWRKLFNAPGIFERQVLRIQGEGVDFSMQLGDMVSRGIRPNFLRFFGELSRLEVKVPYLTVIGNHDRRFPHGVTDSDLYRSLFGRTNYWFDRGPARFVVLDSSAHRVSRRQLAWLDRVLDTPLRKILFTHIPPANLRGWTDFGGVKGVGGFSHGASALTELLSRRRVDRVYLGHIHCFGVQDFGGVRYVLTGGGGSPLYPLGAPDRFHHFLTVEVGPAGIRETVHALDGASLPIPRATVRLAR